jgi:hypothetical protein
MPPRPSPARGEGVGKTCGAVNHWTRKVSVGQPRREREAERLKLTSVMAQAVTSSTWVGTTQSLTSVSTSWPR